MDSKRRLSEGWHTHKRLNNTYVAEMGRIRGQWSILSLQKTAMRGEKVIGSSRTSLQHHVIRIHHYTRGRGGVS